MKNSPLRIGLTGGIGAGKSIVSEIFKLLAVPVYDADSMAKMLMEKDSDLITAIKEAFGIDSYIGRNVNRQFLAERVFNNAPLLEKLNAMVHPVVASHFDHWTKQFDNKYLLKEAALLFETGSYRELDKIILIQSPLEIRIERIKKRDPQRSSQQILNIIERQIPVDEALGLADYIITNDESTMLIPQVLNLQNELTKLV